MQSQFLDFPSFVSERCESVSHVFRGEICVWKLLFLHAHKLAQTDVMTCNCYACEYFILV